MEFVIISKTWTHAYSYLYMPGLIYIFKDSAFCKPVNLVYVTPGLYHGPDSRVSIYFYIVEHSCDSQKLIY